MVKSVKMMLTTRTGVHRHRLKEENTAKKEISCKTTKNAKTPENVTSIYW